VTDSRNDKKRIEETKGGLFRDSYRWILENVEFRRWRNDEQNRLLWIRGDPGKGKTMLLCGIVNELKNSIGDTDLVPFFFCQAADARINNASAVLHGLIYLLVDQQPLLISHLRKKYDTNGKQIFEDVNNWWALSEIFTNILEDPSLLNTYLIIDVFDECIEDLEKLLDLIVEKSTAYSGIKWIVSSRNWPTIGEHLDTATSKICLRLELNEMSISAAVGLYIQHKVDRLAKQKKYDNKIRDVVLHHLSSNATGTFLWVALVCQELAKIERSYTPLPTLKEFPPGLDSLYTRMMEQICNSKSADLCSRILAVMSIVYKPITLDELTSIVDMPEGVSDTQESLVDIIGFCGSFLTLRRLTVYFVHQSAKDFLLGKAFDKIFPSGMEDIHYSIFSASLQVMSGTLRRDIYSLYSPGFPIEEVKKPEPDPLATIGYSCIYWVDHLRDCDPSTNANNDVQDCGSVDMFFRRSYLYWREVLSLLRSMSEGILSMATLERLVQVSSHHLCCLCTS